MKQFFKDLVNMETWEGVRAKLMLAMFIYAITLGVIIFKALLRG